ncbi:MAG: ankyrin repeat domain-containing protein [Planctomycetaceae bacterium]|jgi:ankyrin repeat protein|nr:ankyrin repeat domain-containing protein [Planctomycetaceae bacterium]
MKKTPTPPPENNPFYPKPITDDPVTTTKPSPVIQSLPNYIGKPNVDIFEAVKHEDMAMVKQLFQLQNTKPWLDLINTKDSGGKTPLHCVARNNSNVEVLQYLIWQGAEVNAKDNVGWTPLHSAAFYNSNVEVLQYLISQGIDVNAKDICGMTPLHAAASSNSNVEVLQYLVSKGAEVNAKDKYGGRTPLHLAAFYNRNVEVLQYLISQGIDVNAKDNDGKTPLNLANTDEKKKILRDAGGR